MYIIILALNNLYLLSRVFMKRNEKKFTCIKYLLFDTMNRVRS